MRLCVFVKSCSSSSPARRLSALLFTSSHLFFMNPVKLSWIQSTVSSRLLPDVRSGPGAASPSCPLAPLGGLVRWTKPPAGRFFEVRYSVV